MFYGCSRHQKCSPTAWLAEALLQVEFVEGLAQTQADHSKQTGTPEKLRKWFHKSKTGQRRTFNKCSFTCKSMSQLVLTHNLPCKEHYRARPRKASLLSRGFVWGRSCNKARETVRGPLTAMLPKDHPQSIEVPSEVAHFPVSIAWWSTPKPNWGREGFQRLFLDCYDLISRILMVFPKITRTWDQKSSLVNANTPKMCRHVQTTFEGNFKPLTSPRQRVACSTMCPRMFDSTQTSHPRYLDISTSSIGKKSIQSRLVLTRMWPPKPIRWRKNGEIQSCGDGNWAKHSTPPTIMIVMLARKINAGESGK